jgi:hypothetical protein
LVGAGELVSGLGGGRSTLEDVYLDTVADTR